MIYTSLDTIVRSVLLKENRPDHYYIQYLSYAISGLQKLNTTTMGKINTKLLPVNSYKAVALPIDFVDHVFIGFTAGERVRPLVYDPKLNRLNNYDAQGNKIVYAPVLPDGEGFQDNTFGVPFLPSTYLFNQPVFNHRVDRDDWGYKILPERKEIQLNADFPYDTIVLEYITDGLELDSATKIDPQVRETLEKYILWQAALHRKSSGEGERSAAEQRFLSEWRFYRASRKQLTMNDYIHAIKSGYTGTYR